MNKQGLPKRHHGMATPPSTARPYGRPRDLIHRVEEGQERERRDHADVHVNGRLDAPCHVVTSRIRRARVMENKMSRHSAFRCGMCF